MHAAVAALQIAARRLQLSNETDTSNRASMIAQLREIRDQLAAFERRVGTQGRDPANFAEILREATAAAGSLTTDGTGVGIAAQLPNDIMVEGPGHDLREAFCCLTEYALGAGPGPLNLRVAIMPKADGAREMCAIELTVQSSDLPDFLRRKVWDAARARRGEVSVVAEPGCCRIGVRLPIERRVTAGS